MENSRYKFLNIILEFVSLELGIPISDIESKVRKTHLVNARKLFCYTVFNQTFLNFSLEEIGARVGVIHCTVIYYVREAKNHIELEPVFKEQALNVQQALLSSHKIQELLREGTTSRELVGVDLQQAVELIEMKIRLLQGWLATYKKNPYRIIVLSDLRHCEFELKLKTKPNENKTTKTSRQVLAR